MPLEKLHMPAPLQSLGHNCSGKAKHRVVCRVRVANSFKVGRVFRLRLLKEIIIWGGSFGSNF